MTWSGARRVSLVFGVFCLLAPELRAGIEMPWRFADFAKAPHLVVGRVISVEKDVTKAGPWKGTVAATAQIEVLRAFSAKGATATGTLNVSLFAYGPGGVLNGPRLPEFEPGRVYVFALSSDSPAGTGPWRLVAVNGIGTVLEVRAEMPKPDSDAAKAREFLLREIANSLAGGTPAEVFGTSSYLAKQFEDFTAELMPLLRTQILDDQSRWLEVAAGLLAAGGTENLSVSVLWSGSVPPKSVPPAPVLGLTQAALLKLPASTASERLLIQKLIDDAPIHPPDSARFLVQYLDRPETIEGVRDALGRDLTGSSFIAWTLVRKGQKAFLDEALVRALKVVARPDSVSFDLTGAIILLVDYGSDRQLDQFAGLIRQSRTADPGQYRMLSARIGGLGNPREARIMAPFLTDCSIIPGSERRYCDSAVMYLEQATKERFGAGAKTTGERDQAVARAIAWLDAHGIPH
jgi:hypothetical protein